MNQPDPEYIVNLVYNLVGGEKFQEPVLGFGAFVYISEVNDALFDVLAGVLEQMTVETLARIIEYSDIAIPIGKPPMIRCTSFSHSIEIAARETIGESFQWHDGRHLLEVIACSTLLIIITDMFNQKFYRGQEVIQRAGRRP